MRPLLFMTGVLAALSVAGCSSAVRGSGVIKTESRDAVAVTTVDVSGAFTVNIEVQNEASLELEGDDNILPLIHTDVVDGKLIISSDEKFTVNNPIKIRVATPMLRALMVAGAHTIVVHGISVDRFDLQASGASEVEVEGQAPIVTINASGANTIDAKKLVAKRATVNSSGACNISVHATEELNAEAAGAGGVTYYGNPMIVHQNVTGAAAIRKG